MKFKAMLFAGLWALVILGLSACQAQVPPTSTATPLPPPATIVSATASLVPSTNTPQPPTATLAPSQTATDTPTATETVPPSPTPTSTPVVYVVQAGDTLFDIAAQFHVDVGALTTVNELSSTVVLVGQKLIIPGAEFATPTPSPSPSGLPAGTKIRYKVLLGDTLASIAAKFNSTVDAISKANPDPTAPKNPYRYLTDQNLQAELVIVVPINIATPVPTATAAPG